VKPILPDFTASKFFFIESRYVGASFRINYLRPEPEWNRAVSDLRESLAARLLDEFALTIARDYSFAHVALRPRWRKA
jgi:hypothetical protein